MRHAMITRTSRALTRLPRTTVLATTDPDPVTPLPDPTGRTFFTFPHTKWTKNFSSPLRQWQGTNFMLGDAAHKDLVQKAAGTPSLSFGFSAGGCLFPYYIGVAGALQDAGVMTADTPLGGASAGAIMVACVQSGMGLDDVTAKCMELMDDCRRNGTRGRLGPVLQAFLDSNLPSDAHERCSGRAHIAVTAAFPLVKPQLVSDFHSRDDLIQAVMTSCHIPYWLDNRPVTEFRGTFHLDGGLTNFIPVPPNTVGVRVCCFPSKQINPLYRIGISPDSFDDEWPYTLSQMVGWAFEPAEEEVVVYLIDKGKKDAAAWMAAMELHGAAETVERKDEEQEGEVAAAKATAAGTGEKQTVEDKAGAGAERLEEKKENVDPNRREEETAPVG